MPRGLFILLACGVLSACSATPEKPASASIENRADRLATQPATTDADKSAASKEAQNKGSIGSLQAKSPVVASAAPRDMPTSTVQGSTLPGTNEQNLSNASDEQKQKRSATTLAAKSIFFDYDDYSIKPEYQALIVQRAQLFISQPKLSVRLEGNADERGSREYNIALGQKRAEAVRKALLLNGVPDASIEAISFGNEKPRAECHEERCWAENRRVDFVARESSETQ